MRNLWWHWWKEVDVVIHSSLLQGVQVRSGFGSCFSHGFLGYFRLRQDQEESPVRAFGWGLEAHDIAPALESSTMTLEYSRFLHQKHKSNNTWAPKLYSKHWHLLLCLGLNEGVKSGGTGQSKKSINSSVAPATAMHGLASSPKTMAVQLLHPFLLHRHQGLVYSWDHGKFQIKSKISPSLLPSKCSRNSSWISQIQEAFG